MEKIDLNKKMEKTVAKKITDALAIRLSALQRECKDNNIPVSIVFEGFGASGKGKMINHLIQCFDPRGVLVYSIHRATLEEAKKPYLCRFVSKLPPKGRITIFDRSWYRCVLNDRIDQITKKEQLQVAFNDLVNFERLLTEDGMLIIKFFLSITKEEQKERFQKLKAKKATAWRVKKRDLRQNAHYEAYRKMVNEMIENTDTDNAPWTVVEAMDENYAKVKILRTVIKALEEAIRAKTGEKEHRVRVTRVNNELPTNPLIQNPEVSEAVRTKVLAGVDLTKCLSKEEYKQRVNSLEKELSFLQNELRRRKIPMVLAFEGWDAAGKGGAIKRVTKNLDPRGYEVIPISAPNDLEKSHHYLWRFYNTLPLKGHIAIYDRSWYGRVMVERIEHFCSEAEWKRAYYEINNMEEHWCNSGIILLKFWLHIDKEEQEKRFKARQENENKRWKITEEDFRNREKWEDYEVAVDEMLLRTSTTYAPWTVVEANSKYYARVKVLETVVNAIKERLKKESKKN